jgi:hypothetical protein
LVDATFKQAQYGLLGVSPRDNINLGPMAIASQLIDDVTATEQWRS